MNYAIDKLLAWLVAMAIIYVMLFVLVSFVWLDWVNPISTPIGRGVFAGLSFYIGLKIVNLEHNNA